MLHRRLESSRALSPCFEALETRQLLAAVTVSTASELLNAVNNGADGDVITINAGTYELTETLNLRDDMTLRGAGVDQTILTPVSTWQPGTAGLPDSASSTTNNFNNSAYLLSLVSDHNVVIEDLTLDGNYQVHGGIVAEWSNNFILRDSKLEEFAWSGVRTYKGGNHLYNNNEFINAASKVGATGGMIHSRYLQNSLIDNNTFLETSSHPNETYGIKAEGMSGTRITNNTIQTDGFSIEIAHEHEHSIEIDHNYLSKAVSVPKQGNDNVAGDYSFYIHHNYFKNSYSLEWNRNDIEVAWNLFDFDVNQDGGHLITNFDNGSNASSSGTKFHNNLIKNPGRGLFDAPFGHAYNDFNFYNNHVIGNTTATPRTGGLFGFPTATDESTMTIKDNIFEFNGQSRPLFKNSASYAVNVENNTLTNISDTGNYSNTSTSAVRGTTAPLLFNVGQDGEYLVDGWNISEVGVGGGALGEVGTVTVDQASASAWTTVNLTQTYVDPVVIISPVGDAGADPAVTRVRNVTATSFEVQVDEWDYLDGTHNAETLHYFVVESGRHVLDDGTVLEAGSAQVNQNHATINFSQSFGGSPVVFSSVASVNEATAVTTRQRSVNANSFQVKLQEQEAGAGGSTAHANESVHWLAIDAGTGSVQGLDFEAGTTGDNVTHDWKTVNFTQSYGAGRAVFANLQTTDGNDTTAVRYRNFTATGVEVKGEEEASQDAEIGHTSENVGFLAFETGVLTTGGGGTVTVPAAIAEYRFEQNLNDSAGSNNGAALGDPGYVAGGTQGAYALDLDGNDGINLGANAFINAAFSTRTAAVHFKASSTSGTQMIYDEGGSTNGLAIRLNNGQLQAVVANGSTRFTLSTAFTSTDWSHVAATFDNGMFNLYLNGSLAATTTASYSTVSSHSNEGGFGSVIDGETAFNVSSGGLIGQIDDARVWDVALTAAEVAALI